MSDFMDRLARTIGFQTYNAYLASDYWKQFGERIRQSCCFCCGRTRYLQVHHITYARLGAEHDSDCVTVCGRCHQDIHERARFGIPLAEAHIVHRQYVKPVALTSKIFKKSKKLPRKKNRKPKPLTWVPWSELPNPGDGWTQEMIREWLQARALLDSDEPTDLAYHLFFASLIDGQPLWCRQTYYKTRRRERQEVSR